jgi:hypothetical protein
MVDENASLLFRQYHTPCASYYIGKHKLVWEITGDVLAKCFRDLQQFERSSSDSALEPTLKFSFRHKPTWGRLLLLTVPGFPSLVLLSDLPFLFPLVDLAILRF